LGRWPNGRFTARPNLRLKDGGCDHKKEALVYPAPTSLELRALLALDIRITNYHHPYRYRLPL
jgi:hypothetical protein